jgi:hypothetical protein
MTRTDETHTDGVDEPETPTEEAVQEVGHGVTNRPRGNGDRDDRAVEACLEQLDRAGGGR